MRLSEDALDTLYQASAAIGASLDAHEVRSLLLTHAQGAVTCDAATVLLNGERLDHGWGSSAQLIDTVRQSGRPARSDRALCAPLRTGDEQLGVVALWREPGTESFSADDEKLLAVLAAQAGAALEHARLHRHETHRLALEHELDIATQIQRTLVPSAPPHVNGWTFAAAYQPARGVGGDFYDFMSNAVADGRLGLAVADVTGKGLPAGLMMAYSRAALRAGWLNQLPPRDALLLANRLILEERQPGLFASVFYAELDLASGAMTYASAGHDAPLWIDSKSSAVTPLEAPGVVLGAFREPTIESRSIVVEPGDAVVLYTDGVTEARNEQGDLFGDERLERVVSSAATPATGARSVLDAVLLALADFCGEAEQADDLTVVTIQRDRAF